MPCILLAIIAGSGSVWVVGMSDETQGMVAAPDVVMVGAFPPPVHGMAAVNAIVRQQLIASGAVLSSFDIAAKGLHRGLWSRLGRLPRALRGLFSLMHMRGLGERALYMSVSGGLGQVYELLFVLLARSKAMRVFLHHHSFAYLDRPHRVTTWLVAAAGKHATHIALSPGMAERLRSSYPRVGSVVAISNAALLLSVFAEPAPVKVRLRMLGFLSNIAVEKGVLEFLDVCAAVQERGLPINARLAGPFQDAKVEQVVRQRLADLPHVEYLGPVYGEHKADFYAGTDVLLFPTRYVNEAEPLTVHEAMSAGVPVIAYGRGAIPEILTPACGEVVSIGDDFKSAAMAQIVAWHEAPQMFQAASLAASARFAMLRAENMKYWEAVKAQMLKGNSVALIVDAQGLPSSDQSD